MTNQINGATFESATNLMMNRVVGYQFSFFNSILWVMYVFLRPNFICTQLLGRPNPHCLRNCIINDLIKE